MAEILEPSSRKRKLAAILHADVVGFSRLMGEDEAGTHQALGKLRRTVDPLIAAHYGRIVGTAGDSLLADFECRRRAELRRRDAAGCAWYQRSYPAERRLELRIGVNLGDVIVDGDDIFGDGVNIAARLDALAQPGTICISHTVYDQVRNKLNLDYRPLGSHRVKNIAEPVRAYAVGIQAAAPRPRRGRRVLVAAVGAAALAAAGLIAWRFTRRRPRAARARLAQTSSKSRASPPWPGLRRALSIAVLASLTSDDRNQDYFSDGITEDAITALTLLEPARCRQIGKLPVQGLNASPAEVGRLLDARYSLEAASAALATAFALTPG
jgi:class 3 adenylate cyclase